MSSFSKRFKGLNNIFKFADKKVLGIIEGLLWYLSSYIEIINFKVWFELYFYIT